MSKEIDVNLPDDLYDWMQSQVAAGEADSVSDLIADAVSAVRQRIELAALVADLKAEFGEPSPEAKAQVDRAIAALRAAQRGRAASWMEGIE